VMNATEATEATDATEERCAEPCGYRNSITQNKHKKTDKQTDRQTERREGKEMVGVWIDLLGLRRQSID